MFIPVSLVAAAVQWMVFHRTGLGGFINLDRRRGAVTIMLALLIGDIGGAFVAAAVTGAVSVALNELDAGRPLFTGRP